MYPGETLEEKDSTVEEGMKVVFDAREESVLRGGRVTRQAGRERGGGEKKGRGGRGRKMREGRGGRKKGEGEKKREGGGERKEEGAQKRGVLYSQHSLVYRVCVCVGVCIPSSLSEGCPQFL